MVWAASLEATTAAAVQHPSCSSWLRQELGCNMPHHMHTLNNAQAQANMHVRIWPAALKVRTSTAESSGLSLRSDHFWLRCCRYLAARAPSQLHIFQNVHDCARRSRADYLRDFAWFMSLLNTTLGQSARCAAQLCNRDACHALSNIVCNRNMF
jgi:hypothetical protein